MHLRDIILLRVLMLQDVEQGQYAKDVHNLEARL